MNNRRTRQSAGFLFWAENGRFYRICYLNGTSYPIDKEMPPNRIFWKNKTIAVGYPIEFFGMPIECFGIDILGNSHKI